MLNVYKSVLNFAVLFLAIMAITTPDNALATADGPDYFAVTGVASNDVLNIRARPSYRSRKIGTIPSNGQRIKNLGCQGGPSFMEWENMTEIERKLADQKRWCRIIFQGIEGWVAGRFLAEGH